MTTTINQNEVLFEIMDMYEAGKSKSEVSATLAARGIPSSVADSMAEAGISAFAARLSYVDKENEKVNEGMRRHIKDIAIEIENGRTKEEIVSWLMQQDMPLSLANNLLEAGLGLYRHVVKERKRKEYLKAHAVNAAGLVLGIWAYLVEYNNVLPYVFAATLIMVGISMYRDANEASLNRLAGWAS